jgi:hypothetical protein
VADLSNVPTEQLKEQLRPTQAALAPAIAAKMFQGMTAGLFKGVSAQTVAEMYELTVGEMNLILHWMNRMADEEISYEDLWELCERREQEQEERGAE